MDYLTEYYKNRAITLQEKILELETALTLIQNYDNLNEDWRNYLGRLLGGAADEIAIAAGKKVRYTTKLHPRNWHKLLKEDLAKFVGPPLRWTRPGSNTAREYVLKKIPIKDGELYEVWYWDEAAQEWFQGVRGSTPWGNIGRSRYVNPPSPGLVPGPDGKWLNPTARVSADIADSGPVRAIPGGSENQGFGGGSDEEITI